MATQTVEFRAPTGLTITAKLFSFGSDTQVASVSATEATNRKGTYSAAFTSIAAGEYQLIAFDATPTPVASWWVTLTLTTATFGVYDKADTRDISDNVLSRNVSNVEATMPEHCLGTVVLAMLEHSISGNTLTIKRTDGTTTHATKTLSTDAGADPITGIQ